MEATIQGIFELGYEAYEKVRKLPQHVCKAARSVMVCRTKKLGGHAQQCPDCDYKRIWYNSCKHRMCPKCAYTQIERWLRKQKERLLNTGHYHIVFTISDELHELWRLNRELMADILFKTATETLFQLLADPKHLGAKPGIIASLHTWCKTLALHPHLHCLVTAGGLRDNEWVSSSKSYLISFEIVRAKFRGKFLDHVRKALRSGRLKVPEETSRQKVENLLNKLGRKKWNVHLKETYAHGQGVLTYLARYLRGGPISDRRIKAIKDGAVRFDYGREKREYMELELEQFIGRYLQHVPLPYEIRVRSYGIYHQNCRKSLEQCRKQLGQGPIKDVEFQTWQKLCSEAGEEHPERCPRCGKELVDTEQVIVKVEGGCQGLMNRRRATEAEAA